MRYSDETSKAITMIKDINTSDQKQIPNTQNSNKKKVKLHIQCKDNTDKIMTDISKHKTSTTENPNNDNISTRSKNIKQITKMKRASENKQEEEIVLMTHEQTSITHNTTENEEHSRIGNYMSNIIRHLVSLMILLIMLETTIY